MNNEYILYNISKTMKLMMTFVNTKLVEHGIKDLVPSYVNILLCIYINDGKMKMNEISRQVNKDKSTITVLINRLIERGYVQKEKSNLDRRVAYISLSEKAYGYEDFLNEVSTELKDIAFEDFSDEEKQLYINLTKRINENLTEKI